MRDLVIVLLSAAIIALLIGHGMQEMKIINLERQAIRIEQGYNAVLAENQMMERMHNQTLRLMSEGGWDGFIIDNNDSSSNN